MSSSSLNSGRERDLRRCGRWYSAVETTATAKAKAKAKANTKTKNLGAIEEAIKVGQEY